MKDKDVKGMTVNEQLHTLDLSEAFARAVETRDLDECIEVLVNAKFSYEQATETATMVLADPAKYGY